MAPAVTPRWTRDDAEAFVADAHARARALPPIAGGAPTIEELEARQSEISTRLAEIDNEYAGVIMPEEARSEWNRLGEERAQNETLLAELNQRQEYLRSIADDPAHQERGATFQTPGPRRQGSDIWDLAAVRATARGPEDETRMLRDNALRAVEIAVFPHEQADEDAVRAHIDRLFSRFAGEEADGYSSQARFARHLLATGSPVYQRAFGKYLSGRPLTAEEQRALSLSGSEGGYAVPFQLDPTVIPTSDGSINPVRRLARVETIVGSNTWKGVSSGGITASRAGEGDEASDNAPTLAQPEATVSKVQAFVPFSVDVGQDWGSLQSEMARLLQDAKDDEEASASAATSGFVTGNDTGDNPEGVVTGAGTVAAGTASFAIAHLYALEEALGPRFRSRAQFLADRAIYNRVRQFDTSGGANLWMYLRDGLNNDFRGGNTGASLIGYPANEASAMASAVTTGSKILLLGDFRYYLIVDRIGMTVEVIPHLFGGSGRPTGTRGLYAFWRNTGKVLSSSAFKVLQTT